MLLIDLDLFASEAKLVATFEGQKLAACRTAYDKWSAIRWVDCSDDWGYSKASS